MAGFGNKDDINRFLVDFCNQQSLPADDYQRAALLHFFKHDTPNTFRALTEEKLQMRHEMFNKDRKNGNQPLLEFNLLYAAFTEAQSFATPSVAPAQPPPPTPADIPPPEYIEVVKPPPFKLQEEPESLSPNDCVDKAREAFKQMNYGSAVHYFTLAIEMRPSEPQYYTSRALCYLKLGNMDKVKKDSQKAINLNHQNAKAHYYLSRAFMEEKQYSEAAESLERAIRHETDEANLEKYKKDLAEIRKICPKPSPAKPSPQPQQQTPPFGGLFSSGPPQRSSEPTLEDLFAGLLSGGVSRGPSMRPSASASPNLRLQVNYFSVLVLCDVSPSMGGYDGGDTRRWHPRMAAPKWGKAAQGILKIANQLTPADQLGCIAFADKLHVFSPLAPAPRSAERLQAKFREFTPGPHNSSDFHGTSLYDAVVAAKDQLLQSMLANALTTPRQFKNMIIIISDGDDTTSSSTGLAAATAIESLCDGQLDISVMILGIGMDQKGRRALQVLDAAGGERSQFIDIENNPDAIEKAFEHISVAIERVRC